MKCNIGKTDRIVRIVLGIVIIGIGIYFKSWLALIGLVPLLTAALRWCPLYTPFGISSDTHKEQAEH